MISYLVTVYTINTEYKSEGFIMFNKFSKKEQSQLFTSYHEC